MSKDTITVNMNVYDIPIVVEQLNKLEQENKQLKDKLKGVQEETKDVQKAIKQLQQENKQLKEVIEEVRELIPKQLLSNVNITKYTDEMCLRDILQILDKAKDSDD